MKVRSLNSNATQSLLLYDSGFWLMKGCNQGWMCLNWWRRNWFYTLQGRGNIQWVSGGGSNDKWEERSKTGSPGPGAPNQICHCSQWPIKIMDDARARQMEIMEIIFSKTITWWFTFLSTPEFYLKHPHLSVSSLLFWFVVIFLWWLIRPVPPSLHTSLFALVNAGARFPPLPRIPQFTKCLPISTSSGRHWESPLAPPWQLLLQEASIITPRQFPQ